MALPFNKLKSAMPGQQTVSDDMGAVRMLQAASQVSPIKGAPVASQKQVAQVAGALEEPKQAERVKQFKEGTDLRVKDTQRELQQQALQSQERLSSKQLAISQTDRKLREQLNALSSEEYNKLFNETMQFKRDELGRTQWNERQLADWAISKAKTDEELQEYSNLVTQAYDRKAQIKKHSYDMIMEKLSSEGNAKLQQLEQAFTKAEAKLNNQLKIEIDNNNFQAQAQIKNRMDEIKYNIQEERNKLEKNLAAIDAANKAQAEKDRSDANNTLSMFQAGGTILGALAGIPFAAATGGASVVAGASIGGGLGSVAGSKYNK